MVLPNAAKAIPAQTLPPQPSSSNDNSPVAANRKAIVASIAAHLATGPDAWKTLPQVLRFIMKGKKPEELFAADKLHPKLEPGKYSKEIVDPNKVLTQEELNKTKEKFNVAFFAFPAGAISPVHNHKVNCISYIIEGQLKETNYRQYNRSHVVETISSERTTGTTVADIKTPGKRFTHRIENKSPTTKYSMHVYNCAADENPNDTVYDDTRVIRNGDVPYAQKRSGIGAKL